MVSDFTMKAGIFLLLPINPEVISQLFQSCRKGCLRLLCISKTPWILLERELQTFTLMSVEAQKIASTLVYFEKFLPILSISSI